MPSSDDRNELVEFKVTNVKAVTAMAMLCVIDDEEHWLPLSQIEETDCEARGDSGFVLIPRWLADEKGLQE